MLQYLGNDAYEFWPSKGEPIVLTIDDIDTIAQESKDIENSYVNKLVNNDQYWENHYKELVADIQRLLP